MARVRFISLLAVVSLISCGAVRPTLPDSSPFQGSRFDVDINGRIIVVDRKENVLRQFSKDHLRQKEIGGTGWNDGQFDQPSGVWARNGIDVFVADYGNHRIQRFDRNLAFVSSFSTRGRANADERFGYPTDVAISRLGDLFICDSENSRVLKIVGLSKVEKAFGGFDAGKGRLRQPTQIEIGPNDNVYVLDGSRVVVFDNFGNFVRILGEGIFDSGVKIFADESGLVLFDADKMLFFDRDERLVLEVAVEESLPAGISEARDFAFSRGTAYFLTSDGIVTAPDPRSIESKK